jgi:hypothetical protein
MRKGTRDYNLTDWVKHFKVSNSPSGLSTLAGKECGHLKKRKDGSVHCWIVGFDGKQFKIHRIIWILMQGSIAVDVVVDHLDGDASNNSPVNLCVKTQRMNTRNRKLCNSNTSGFVGVKFNSRLNKDGSIYNRWTAQWVSLEGKLCCAYFPVNKHGYETAKQMAIDYRNLQIQLLNAAGASYTERHQGIPSTA